MDLIKKLCGIFIAIGLGLVFLYSAYTKFFPVIETFEFTFVDIGVANWYTAPIFARLLIAMELFLGVLLVLNYNLKKFTLPVSIGLLAFFIVYLILQIIVSGNEGNCGCFGEHLKMTPLEAVIKNVIMIALSVAVFILHKGWHFKFNGLFLVFTATTCAISPFVLNPIDYSYSSNNLAEKVNYKLDLDLLYNPEDTVKVQIPKIELRKDKQVLAFLSLSCGHCRVAAKKFKVIKKENPALPIYFVLNGDRKKFKEFIEDTRATNVPYSFCLGKTFVQLASAQLPRIYYLDNSIVVKKVDYYELSQYEIEQWITTGKVR